MKRGYQRMEGSWILETNTVMNQTIENLGGKVYKTYRCIRKTAVRVLVTGGTGFVGSQIVAALVRRGDAVRVLHRATSNLIMLEGLPVEIPG